MQHPLLSYLLFVVATLCAVTSANPSPPAMLIAPRGVPGPTDDWRSLLRRDVDGLRRAVERRQSSSSLDRARNDTAIEEIDMQKWAKETTLKCIEKLRNVTRASNPSGIAVCYNLPFLSVKSGVFAADLRLYQVSAPDKEWVSAGGDIDVSLIYKGAAVQLRNESSEEAAATAQASASIDGPQKVQEFHFIGQIDKILLAKDLTDIELQTMLKPNISLIASGSGGTQLSTVLSSEEATFVNGVFADVPSLNQNDTAKDIPFQLPGTRIEIVPVGLYFFGSYLVVACSIFGWGSLERQKFRDQYRKRVAWRGMPGGVPGI